MTSEGRQTTGERAEAALSLDIRVTRAGGTDLVEDYVGGRPGALSLYVHDWRDPESYRSRARILSGRWDGSSREGAAEAVRTSHPAAARQLDRLVEEGGFFVTTGQQPGLFGGPLYSLYKALSAVRLAEELEDLLEVPVQPLFWVASEDHDWEEAHETWIVDVDNDLRHVVVPRPEGVGEAPLHRIPVGEPLEAALARFLDALPETDFSEPWTELLEGAWTSGTTLADGFVETLEGLLGPLGVAFTSAHDSVLKRRSVPVLRRELEASEAHEEALVERSRGLEERGYHVQVPVLEDGVNLFVEGPGGRERLYRNAGDFHLRRSGTTLTADELEEILTESPERVSPNVLLRPVVESAVFPTLAYVGGPGEVAYFAQLAPLYDALEVPMPVVHPRFSVTVVESKVGKVLEKFALEIETLSRPFHEIAGEVARDEIPPEAERLLGELKGAVGTKTGELTKAVRDLDPTLKGPISHARSTIFDALGDLEKKLVQAAKRESEIALQQVEKAQLHLFPEGKPQERRMNPFYYLVRYGERFLHEISAHLPPALPTTTTSE